MYRRPLRPRRFWRQWAPRPMLLRPKVGPLGPRRWFGGWWLAIFPVTCLVLTLALIFLRRF